MASGILSNGVDLDNIFSLYASGTQPGATGILIAGADINTRYQPLSAGNPVSATDIFSNSADLNTIFGTVTSGGVVINPGYTTLGATASISHGSGNATATASFELFSNGTYSLTEHGGGSQTGNWFTPTTAGIGSTYKVQWTFTQGSHGAGSVGSSNPAPTPTSLSSDQTFTCFLTYGAGGVSSSVSNGSLQIEILDASNTVLSNVTIATLCEVDVV